MVFLSHTIVASLALPAPCLSAESATTLVSLFPTMPVALG
jgi:hypothetical protein